MFFFFLNGLLLEVNFGGNLLWIIEISCNLVENKKILLCSKLSKWIYDCASFYCLLQDFSIMWKVLTAEGFSETASFMRFSNQVFQSQFQKYLSYEVQFFQLQQHQNNGSFPLRHWNTGLVCRGVSLILQVTL